MVSGEKQKGNFISQILLIVPKSFSTNRSKMKGNVGIRVLLFILRFSDIRGKKRV